MNIENYEIITELNLSGKGLKELPDWVSKCTNLKVLNCNYNRLNSLPPLPISLTKLYCYNNRITSLPPLPINLTELDCSDNQLTSLHPLPINLTKLYCYNNRLSCLPPLPINLTKLHCSTNQLTSLPHLPATLIELYCYNNQLTSLSPLPATLTMLYCSHNQLTSLAPLITCTRLRFCDYSNNETTFIPEPVRRILNRQKLVKNIADDKQNVHSSSIQESLGKSIVSLLEAKKVPEYKEVLEDVLADKVLTEKCKQALVEYCNQKDVHSTLNVTFKEVFVLVWKRIVDHEQGDEIKKVLNQEMSDSLCMCFTGRISRLVNSLNGYCEDVQIQISKNERIGNIISYLIGKYQGEELRQKVREELKEENEEDVEDWLRYL